ncbi:MAG: hypothetical protein KDK30_07660 [Leptospiraceae bacterium]|nr:hypothetical protein [Leptospiraceae bacterium]
MQKSLSPVPLLVGVTGHRDISENECLRLKPIISRVFNDLRNIAPRTPIHLLTPLAKGADRLAAEVALQNEIPFVAVLPMPQHLYEADFQDPEDLSEFRRLLSCASRVLTLPLHQDNTEADISHDGPARNLEYAKVGAYISDHSAVMMALWNGYEPESEDLTEVGGTEQIVRYRIMGRMKSFYEPDSILQAPDYNNIIFIFTQREFKQNHIQEIPSDLKDRFTVEVTAGQNSYHFLSPPIWRDDVSRGEWGSEFSKSNIIRLNQFNRDLKKYANYSAVWKSGENLCPGADDSNGKQAYLKTQFGAADVLANVLQKKNRRHFLYTLLLGVSSFTALAIFDMWLTIPLFFLSAPFLLLAAALLHLAGRFKKIEHRYYEYRTLAEGLRVYFFWSRAKIRGNMSEVYPSKYRDDLQWILYYFGVVDLLCSDPVRGTESHQPNPSALSGVREHWIQDQISYYGRCIQKNSRWMMRRSVLNWILGVVLAVIGISIFIGVWNAAAGMVASGAAFIESNLYKILAITLDLFIALGAAHAAFQEWESVSDESRLYNRMLRLFRRSEYTLAEMLKRGNEPESARRVYLELGEISLAEHADWLNVQKSRTMDLHLG